MSIRIIVAQVVLGLLFFLIGSMIIAGMKPLVENFRHFGIWIPVLAELASAGLALVMLGAVFTHVRVRDPLKKATPAIVLGALASLVVISYWPTFIPLLTSR